jgi:hypothetical protein
MSNPSLLSIATDIHPESSVSNSSSTTVTQRSYADRSDDDDDDDHDDSNSEPETYISEASEGPKEMTDTKIKSAQPNVFQYMQQVPTVEEYSDEENGQSPHSAASSASSEDESEHEGTQSSHTGSSQLARDTPTTSPASMRTSEPDAAQHQPRKYRNATRPMYASSFVHGHGGHEDDEEPEVSEEASDDDSDESEDDHEAPHHHDPSHAPNLALQRTSPPRAPSASSGHYDPRVRRLKQQEQDLANHILQSPQPKKDFQFAGGPSPHPQPSMPLYSPHAYSGAAPANFEPTAAYPAAEWPHFPPPLPIGYHTQSILGSPTAGHALPLTVQPPMGMSSVPVQQHPPPFQQYPGQPPQYQAHVPASDVTRTAAAGYELLANKLSETPKKSSKLVRKAGNVVPMYRKFEHLNHRVLLHLQDEVCEMEEELRHLDESIVQTSPRTDMGHTFPASRRNDARHGSELHYKRTELLGHIFQKLGQYSKCYANDPAYRPRDILHARQRTPQTHQ